MLTQGCQNRNDMVGVNELAWISVAQGALVHVNVWFQSRHVTVTHDALWPGGLRHTWLFDWFVCLCVCVCVCVCAWYLFFTISLYEWIFLYFHCKALRACIVEVKRYRKTINIIIIIIITIVVEVWSSTRNPRVVGSRPTRNASACDLGQVT